MKAVLQCCSSGSVTVDGEMKGKVGRGYVILVGINTADTREEARFLAEKCAGLRVFEDQNGKLNLSVKDIGGEVLVISNFTLYADARHGRRPSYINAARPENALPLYEYFVECLRQQGIEKVETGVFGAEMKVDICNHGPVTLVLGTDEIMK